MWPRCTPRASSTPSITCWPGLTDCRPRLGRSRSLTGPCLRSIGLVVAPLARGPRDDDLGGEATAPRSVLTPSTSPLGTPCSWRTVPTRGGRRGTTATISLGLPLARVHPTEEPSPPGTFHARTDRGTRPCPSTPQAPHQGVSSGGAVGAAHLASQASEAGRPSLPRGSPRTGAVPVTWQTSPSLLGHHRSHADAARHRPLVST